MSTYTYIHDNVAIYLSKFVSSHIFSHTSLVGAVGCWKLGVALSEGSRRQSHSHNHFLNVDWTTPTFIDLFIV